MGWNLEGVQLEEIQDLRWWSIDDAKSSKDTRKEFKQVDWQTITTAAAGIKVFVYNYLATHYDPKDIQWVLDASWELDDAVPLTTIKYENRPDGESQKHVDHMADKISKDPYKMQPVVIVDDGKGYTVADGYHRCAAMAQLGEKTISAYIATPQDGWQASVTRMQADVKNHPLDKIEQAELHKSGNAQALIDWYNSGADGQIDWGSAGDFDQCVAIAGQYVDDPQGFCNLRHQDATGAPPGKAPSEKVMIGKVDFFTDENGIVHPIAGSDGYMDSGGKDSSGGDAGPKASSSSDNSVARPGDQRVEGMFDAAEQAKQYSTTVSPLALAVTSDALKGVGVSQLIAMTVPSGNSVPVRSMEPGRQSMTMTPQEVEDNAASLYVRPDSTLSDAPIPGFVPLTSSEGNQMLRDAIARGVLQQWNKTSNDNNAGALAMQEVAIREFGLKDTAPWKTNVSGQTLDQHIARSRDVYSRILRAQYDATQKAFSDAGITEVVAFRGVVGIGSDIKEGESVDFQSRPLSSWSTSADSAALFGGPPEASGAMLVARIPVASILSIPSTGFGTTTERELVTVGTIQGARGAGFSASDNFANALTGREQAAGRIAAKL